MSYLSYVDSFYRHMFPCGKDALLGADLTHGEVLFYQLTVLAILIVGIIGHRVMTRLEMYENHPIIDIVTVIIISSIAFLWPGMLPLLVIGLGLFVVYKLLDVPAAAIAYFIRFVSKIRISIK